jgi:TonB family protein
MLSLVAVAASATAVARADECPVSVSSVELEGKGVANHIFRYRIALNAQTATNPPDVIVQIQFGDRQPIQVVASHLQFNSHTDSSDDVRIFERPSEDVTGAAVTGTESGANVVPCTSPIALVGHSSSPTDWITPTVSMTVNDTTAASPDASRVDLISVSNTDASFKHKAPLNYPTIARDQNISGTARAFVEIGPQGQRISSRIAYSSGSKVLDAAALSTLNQSEFLGSTFEGIPVESGYYIVYEFRLDDGIPVEIPDLLKTYCPAIIDGISLSTNLFSGSAYWYNVELTTTPSTFDSVSLAVVGSQGPVKILQWRTITSGAHRMVGGYLGGKSAYKSEAGALFWPGDALAAGVVQDVTPHLRQLQTCKPYGAHVDYNADPDSVVAIAETDKPWLDAPVLETVLPARFKNVVWPKYVPSTSDPTYAVAVDVDVHVTQLGEPLVAIVRKASLAPEFAKAALDAAMASTYAVPHTADGAPLTQTFNITYLYVPAN